MNNKKNWILNIHKHEKITSNGKTTWCYWLYIQNIEIKNKYIIEFWLDSNIINTRVEPNTC